MPRRRRTTPDPGPSAPPPHTPARAFGAKGRRRAALLNQEKAEIPYAHAEHGQTTLRYERYPSGRHKGLLISVNRQIGAHSITSRAVGFSYLLRKKLKPIRVSDCRVLDKEGRLIAVFRIDPVTGRRTRESLL